MHLYLIRHGESYVNLPDWDGGNMDTGLTALGQRQAAALADWLPGHLPTIDALYTSTMRRALETTAYLSQVYPNQVYKDDRLREIGNNRLDHVPWSEDEMPREFAGFWSTERPFTSPVLKEGGENLMHFRTRAGSFLAEALTRHRDQIIVAVCHGGIIDATFDNIFNIGPWRQCEIWSRNTSLTYFEYVAHPGRERWRLHYQNRIEHLQNVT